ncbi:MAG: 4-(cytidine 5'-diphospho)-2-C-methyl-D-erythritol kinase [Candidatus Kapabacteria bacterium]|nr:4-(cytidine 5'-diphospho)-2-C-methyl-D-erythritol kinase [Candidatus Kapabacteria bacterium]
MEPMHPDSAVHILACAKINLGLEVLRKRPDGYHDIRSVFASIDLADSIEVHPSTTIEVLCEPAMTAAPEQNLAYRAAQAILAHPSAAGLGAKIVLRKRIPAGGGLGGGSSDAAAVLRAVRAMYALPIPDQDLHHMALSIGSDVPYFLIGGTALVEGRGEVITPISLHLPYHVVVVVPHIHVPTATAYAGIKTREDNTVQEFLQILDNTHSYKLHLHNRFEEGIFLQHPVLKDVKDALYEKGALYASMSGSGSTMYGLFPHVDNFAAQLRETYPHMDVIDCSFVTAPPPIVRL